MINKLKKFGLFQFGKTITGLKINGTPAPYPVLNENAVRAGAGIMLAIGLFGFANGYFSQNFIPLKIISIFFFLDFFTKTFIGTRFSIVGHIGQFIVKKQKPEYVGAIQKRFSWGIGLIMSSLMIFLLFIFEPNGLIILSVCSICLLIIWFESCFGICLGCKIYYGLIKKGLIKEPAVRPACPGGVCSIGNKH